MPLFGDALVIGHWCLSDLTLGAPVVSHRFEDSCWRDGQTPHDGFYFGGSTIFNADVPTNVDGHADVEVVGVKKQAIAASHCCSRSAAGVRLQYDGDPIFTEVVFSVGAVQPAHNGCFVPVGAIPWWSQSNFSFGVWAYGNPAPYVVWPGSFRERIFNGGAIADASFAVFGDGVPVGWSIHSNDGVTVLLTFTSETPGASFSLSMGSLGTSSSDWNFYGFSADSHGVRAYKNGVRTDHTALGMAIGGQQLTFGNRNASGTGDVSQMADPFNGAFGAPIMLSRALSDDEWTRFFALGCAPQARIKKRFKIKVTNDNVPTNAVGNTPGGDSPAGGTSYTTGGSLASVPTPPTGFKWPRYQVAKWGASLYRDTKFGAGTSSFAVRVWPTNTWSALSFAALGVLDLTNPFVNPPLGEITLRWFYKNGDEYVRYGWNSPEISVPVETPEWSGPIGSVDPSVGWGLTGISPSFPHWDVSTADSTYQMLTLARDVPPWSTADDGGVVYIPAPVAIDGVTYNEHMLFDTGVMNPDYFRANFPLTYSETDLTFNTYGNVWPALNTGAVVRASRGYLLGGQLQFPSKSYWGFGFDWSAYKTNTFKARVRETVTNTVVSQDSRTGQDMSFHDTPNLDLVTGHVDFSLAPDGHAIIPSGRKFIVEVWQDTGTELILPIWGNMALHSHYGGGIELLPPYVDTSEDGWPTLP